MDIAIAGEPKTLVVLDPTSPDGEAALQLLDASSNHIGLMTLLGHDSAQYVRRYAASEDIDVLSAAGFYLESVADRILAEGQLIETIISADSDLIRAVVDYIELESVSRVLLPRSMVGATEEALCAAVEALDVDIAFGGATVATQTTNRKSRRRGRKASGLLLDHPSMAEVPVKEVLAVEVLSTYLRIPAESTLIQQDSKGSQCVFVVDGELNVVRDGAQIASLGPGSTAGEISLLTGGRCNAEVTAATDAAVLVMTQREFSTMLTDCPTMANKVLTSAVHRLAAA